MQLKHLVMKLRELGTGHVEVRGSERNLCFRASDSRIIICHGSLTERGRDSHFHYAPLAGERGLRECWEILKALRLHRRNVLLPEVLCISRKPERGRHDRVGLRHRVPRRLQSALK